MIDTLTNGYKVGSLAWVERQRYNEVRDLLDSVIFGDVSVHEARESVQAMDTDRAHFLR